jgi:hypothetical protein
VHGPSLVQWNDAARVVAHCAPPPDGAVWDAPLFDQDALLEKL